MNEDRSDIYDIIFCVTFRRMSDDMPNSTGTWLAVRERIAQQAERATVQQPGERTAPQRRMRHIEVDA
jgi:hypothetical protein